MRASAGWCVRGVHALGRARRGNVLCVCSVRYMCMLYVYPWCAGALGRARRGDVLCVCSVRYMYVGDMLLNLYPSLMCVNTYMYAYVDTHVYACDRFLKPWISTTTTYHITHKCIHV